MKKIFLSLCGFVLMSLPAMAASFPDVPADHKNFDAVEFLDEKGIIHGYADGTFGPENMVNRAEAAKIIVGAFGIDSSGNYEVIFDDVPKDQWFFAFVMGGRNAGIIDGYPNGNFQPEASVNLAETLKMSVLASKLSLPTEVNENVFLDVSKDVWYAPHALFAKTHNVVFADHEGNLRAEKAMSRGDFAEIIYRMMVVLENDGEAFPLDINWQTYTSDSLPFQIKYDDNKWQVIKNNHETIFFKPDEAFQQFSPGRLYLNSAMVWVTLDENDSDMSKSQYFSNIRTAFPFAEYTEFNFRGLSAFEVLYPNDRIVDWYIYLSDGRVLAIYTQYGNGVLGYELQQVIKTMLSTLEYKAVSAGNNYSEILSEIFASVLVEGSGMSNLNKLPEKTIIETDTIGLGTGPVDYYYSQSVDYTFKYEREGDVILDTRKGQTSSF